MNSTPDQSQTLQNANNLGDTGGYRVSDKTSHHQPKETPPQGVADCNIDSLINEISQFQKESRNIYTQISKLNAKDYQPNNNGVDGKNIVECWQEEWRDCIKIFKKILRDSVDIAIEVELHAGLVQTLLVRPPAEWTFEQKKVKLEKLISVFKRKKAVAKETTDGSVDLSDRIKGLIKTISEAPKARTQAPTLLIEEMHRIATRYFGWIWNPNRWPRLDLRKYQVLVGGALGISVFLAIFCSPMLLPAGATLWMNSVAPASVHVLARCASQHPLISVSVASVVGGLGACITFEGTSKPAPTQEVPETEPKETKEPMGIHSKLELLGQIWGLLENEVTRILATMESAKEQNEEEDFFSAPTEFEHSGSIQKAGVHFM